MKQSPIKNRLIQAHFLFLLSGMIGWIYEVALAFFYGYGFINRGFLFGLYLPLYGLGALLAILILDRVIQSSLRIGRAPMTSAIVFLSIVLMTTVVEYAGGYVAGYRIMQENGLFLRYESICNIRIHPLFV